MDFGYDEDVSKIQDLFKCFIKQCVLLFNGEWYWCVVGGDYLLDFFELLKCQVCEDGLWNLFLLDLCVD